MRAVEFGIVGSPMCGLHTHAVQPILRTAVTNIRPCLSLKRTLYTLYAPPNRAYLSPDVAAPRRKVAAPKQPDHVAGVRLQPHFNGRGQVGGVSLQPWEGNPRRGEVNLRDREKFQRLKHLRSDGDEGSLVVAGAGVARKNLWLRKNQNRSWKKSAGNLRES